MAKIKKKDHTMLWKGFRTTGHPHLCGTASLKNNLAFLNKVKQTPYDPAIAVLGIFPGELKTYVHTNTCTGMFRAALFVMA